MKKYIIKRKDENGEWYFTGIQFDSKRDEALKIDEEELEKAKKIFEILAINDYDIIPIVEEKEKKMKEFLEIDENIRNRDIANNAIDWLKALNPKFKDMDDVELKMIIYSFNKCARQEDDFWEHIPTIDCNLE